MRIHKGTLVRRTQGFNPITQPWFCQPGIILAGPYEDYIHLANHPLNVTNIILVCDLMIDGIVYSKVPVEHLEKIRP